MVICCTTWEIYLCVLITMVCWMTKRSRGNSIYPDEDLIDELLRDYNAEARPIKHGSELIHLQLEMYLYSFQLDEVHQNIRLQFYAGFLWTDPRLTWNSTQFGDITSTSLSPGLIWTPQVVAQFLKKQEITSSGLMVFNDGNIVQYEAWDLTVPCVLDIQNFPFDNQSCGVALMAVGNTLSVNFTFLLLSDSHLIPDAIWNLDSVEAGSYTVSPEYPSSPKITLAISRKKLYNWLIYIIPLLILDVLGNFGLLIPNASGEKLGYLVSIELTVFFFFLLILERIPPSSESVPLLNWIVLITLFKNMIEIISSIAVGKLSGSCHTKPPPRYLLPSFYCKKAAVSGTNPNQVSKLDLGSIVDIEPTGSYDEQWNQAIRFLEILAFTFYTIWGGCMLIYLLMLSI